MPGAPHRTRLTMAALLALIGLPTATAWSADTHAAAQLARFSAQAGRPGQAAAGQSFFVNPHGQEWSCGSCHGTVPTQSGRHAKTGKTLAPLAPAFNPQGFTDTARMDKWFKRNCQDVLGRECSAGEKADVLAWLIGLR